MNNDSAEWGGGQLAGNGRTAAGLELFDVLDENGHKTGKTKERSQVHRDGDWHRAVNIWVINDHDEVLLQKRAAHKDSWPGYWGYFGWWTHCGGRRFADRGAARII